MTTDIPTTSGQAGDFALGLLAKGGDDIAAVVYELDAIRMELRTANYIALLANPDFGTRYNDVVKLILEGLELQ